ncbi:MAG: glycosyltransferase family 39 protein [Candidatus Diapherotrites archaeon]|nr:glycosyltransferase family 39 protein [Candidatus Diapherotrites archaeon]
MQHDKMLVLAAILTIVLAGQVFLASQDKNLVGDERAHITAGTAYVQTGSLLMNAEHPPLIKYAAGVLLSPLRPVLPTESEAWQMGDMWGVSRAFVDRNLAIEGSMRFLARLIPLFLVIVLGIAVFFAARSYGPAAALLALLFVAFEPNIIAHAQFLTMDLPVTCFFFVSFAAFLAFSRDGGRKWLALSAVAAGLALLSKFTAFLLFPSLLFALPLLWKRLAGSAPRKAVFCVASIIVVFVAAVSILFAGYGFADMGVYDVDYKGYSVPVTGPKMFAAGMAWNARHESDGHYSYLDGVSSLRGWWYYYAVAALLKTPLPLLLLFSVGLLTLPFSKRRSEWLAWLGPVIVVFAFYSLFSRVQIGLRYVLIAYPFLAIIASRVVQLNAFKRPAVRAVLLILCAWIAVGTLLVFPNHLAYFNELVPRGEGHNYLLDSNLDWSQDQSSFAAWAKSSGIGFSEPSCVPRPGVYFAPASLLHGVVVDDYNLEREGLAINEARYCLTWLQDYEPFMRWRDTIFVYNVTELRSDESVCAGRGVILNGYAGRYDGTSLPLASVEYGGRTFPVKQTLVREDQPEVGCFLTGGKRRFSLFKDGDCFFLEIL